jgi:hypothetical protein
MVEMVETHSVRIFGNAATVRRGVLVSGEFSCSLVPKNEGVGEVMGDFVRA